MEPLQTGLGAWKTCLKWITRACGGLMLSVICCRPGPRHTGSLPCSSGLAAAGLRDSCWRPLHSGRLRWSVWQQLQPAWLQPAEDSDTGQSKIVLQTHTLRLSMTEAVTMSSKPLMISILSLFATCLGSALPDELGKTGRHANSPHLLFVKDWLDLLQVLCWPPQVPVSSWTQWPCHTQKIILHSKSPQPLALQSFHPDVPPSLVNDEASLPTLQHGAGRGSGDPTPS